MTPIERRAEQLREKYPNALAPTTPTWWLVIRPVVKVLCLTAIVAPTAAATSGVAFSPFEQFVMLLIVAAAGYATSEMSPGFRAKGDDRG